MTLGVLVGPKPVARVLPSRRKRLISWSRTCPSPWGTTTAQSKALFVKQWLGTMELVVLLRIFPTSQIVLIAAVRLEMVFVITTSKMVFSFCPLKTSRLACLRLGLLLVACTLGIPYAIGRRSMMQVHYSRCTSLTQQKTVFVSPSSTTLWTDIKMLLPQDRLSAFQGAV
ncbi:hypothetical protein F441_11388 [Phytophthora nicotianae CJ01A1]|uniref:Uncharacterized protein n=4 Tax=Phytophthora nicotianae TaxID=4792 RepID=W2Q3K6_PHYN3|nr:hypothetical protein PPTG_13530 [Phytophthora nicotianae INRA-310]ETI43655.1 hypothetical protein F443_11466 [Phytophthora nicotianae P1569]ETK83722.1 hypothetical protein L915_11157 [Phytophthora nicotianae]ETP13467.1 hypothetical protein F441_11388 [Phytophthora nicotianae CJ01A1]ETL90300.1 hypothetical protein L917_10962 [Phytophthora nicotianae]ETM43600.1 hypothetical protein L914_10990 [Phytophthora nicotianae]